MQPERTIIDAFSHIAPKRYIEALDRLGKKTFAQKFSYTPPIWDLEQRFRIMDNYPGLVQVLTLAEPAIEEVAESQKAIDLARLANDEMAELVFKNPDRFVGAIACLPMNEIDAALKEIDRAVNDLKLRGVLVYSNVNDKPLDAPHFMPLYEKMSEYDLPIYIHPLRRADFPDYRTEEQSKYSIYAIFGWPFDTTVAMTRLVFSGVLEKYPKLKIVTHHCGGMVSFYAQRIIQHHQKYEFGMARHGGYTKGLTKAPIEYFKIFYNDTAVHGNLAALMCAYDFWGADKLIFGADIPLGDRSLGRGSYLKTVNAIEQMAITDEEKKKIFEDNAKNLMRLPV